MGSNSINTGIICCWFINTLKSVIIYPNNVENLKIGENND